jgi:hypothetical protein
MILLLTLAGRGEPFIKQGYNTPKYLLPWGAHTVLGAILHEFLKQGGYDEVFLIANRRDEAYLPHVRVILREHRIPEDHLLLTADTRGQAETAALAVAEIIGRGVAPAPLVISNVDTILYGRDGAKVADSLRGADGHVDVFRSSNRNYSYVMVDGQGRVQQIAEKIVVSDVATSGCYGFRDPATYQAHHHADDVYISAVFKRMISAGKVVVAGARHSEADTVVLGTPDQYLNESLVRLS